MGGVRLAQAFAESAQGGHGKVAVTRLFIQKWELCESRDWFGGPCRGRTYGPL